MEESWYYFKNYQQEDIYIYSFFLEKRTFILKKIDDIKNVKKGILIKLRENELKKLEFFNEKENVVIVNGIKINFRDEGEIKDKKLQKTNEYFEYKPESKSFITEKQIRFINYPKDRKTFLSLGYNYNIFLVKKKLEYDIYTYLITLIIQEIFFLETQDYPIFLKKKFLSKKQEIDLFFKNNWKENKKYKKCLRPPFTFFNDCDKIYNVLEEFSKKYTPFVEDMKDEIIYGLIKISERLNIFTINDVEYEGKIREVNTPIFYGDYMQTLMPKEPQIKSKRQLCYITNFKDLVSILKDKEIKITSSIDYVLNGIFFTSNIHFPDDDECYIEINNKILDKYNYYLTRLYFGYFAYKYNSTFVKGQFENISAFDKAESLDFFKKRIKEGKILIVLVSNKDVSIKDYIVSVRVNSQEQKQLLINMGIEKKIIKLKKSK